MAQPTRDEEFSAFVRTSRPGLLRSACLLTAGDSHLAEDLVQTALARLYVAWPKVRRSGTQLAYTWRIQPGGGTRTAGLVIQEAPGRWLLVQAPTSLGWSRQQMLQFGLGVTVLPTAQQGKG